MPHVGTRYQFGPFELDAAEHRLLRDGVEVSLQLKAFAMLCVLVENAGRLLKKEDLLRQVWPDTVVEENNLNKSVSLLRKALGEHAAGQSYIETVPRAGYRFVAPVIRIEPQAASSGANDLLDASLPDQPDRSVAVLYFENLSGAKEDEYFRDGMTEDVITELAKIKNLRVVPRSAVLAFRDKTPQVAQVGQQLRSAYVLQGSIRRADSRLRVTVQLAEARTGHSVWAERYDRQMEDVFAIQDEIAQNIARALSVMLTEGEKHEIEKTPTRNIQAYDYYLRGRQFFYQMTRKGLESARQMFARAIVLDPGYARAYAGVADCCCFLYIWSDSSLDNLREALSASCRAAGMDPQSAEAHASCGFAEYLNKNYEQAEKEFQIAIHLDFRLFEAYYFYARSCFERGQYEKAASLFARASQANPDDYQAHTLRGLCFQALHRVRDACEAFRLGVQKAEHQLERHPDDVKAFSTGASALYGIGDWVRAREWADRALSLEPEEGPILYNVACVFALLRESDKAIACLEKAFALGYGNKAWIKNDPDLSSVRDHPRFQALIHGM